MELFWILMDGTVIDLTANNAKIKLVPLVNQNIITNHRRLLKWVNLIVQILVRQTAMVVMAS